jgi:hypothetical protein
MNAACLQAMSDELTKLAGIADRDYIRNGARQAGKHWGKFKGWFNRQGAVGQSAVIGGIAGGVAGGIKGFTKNDPQIDYNTGEVRRPSVVTRAGRGARGAISGGAGSAAMSAGTSYLVRKLTHQ